MPWACTGLGLWAFHGSALWISHWDAPNGAPMALHGYCSIGAPWKCLMGNTWGSPHVASMGLDGDSSLGLPWDASMGKAVGLHGLALGLAIGHSMEVL